MRIEYDSEKDAANRAKHGVPLAFGARAFEDAGAVVSPTSREEDEEERSKGIGVLEGKLWTAVHVWRGEVARFMSVRRSNGAEQRAYYRHPSGSE